MCQLADHVPVAALCSLKQDVGMQKLSPIAWALVVLALPLAGPVKANYAVRGYLDAANRNQGAQRCFQVKLAYNAYMQVDRYGPTDAATTNQLKQAMRSCRL